MKIISKLMKAIVLVLGINVLLTRNAYADVASPPVFTNVFLLIILGFGILFVCIIAFFIIQWIKRKNDRKYFS